MGRPIVRPPCSNGNRDRTTAQARSRTEDRGEKPSRPTAGLRRRSPSSSTTDAPEGRQSWFGRASTSSGPDRHRRPPTGRRRRASPLQQGGVSRRDRRVEQVRGRVVARPCRDRGQRPFGAAKPALDLERTVHVGGQQVHAAERPAVVPVIEVDDDRSSDRRGNRGIGPPQRSADPRRQHVDGERRRRQHLDGQRACAGVLPMKVPVDRTAEPQGGGDASDRRGHGESGPGGPRSPADGRARSDPHLLDRSNPAGRCDAS